MTLSDLCEQVTRLVAQYGENLTVYLKTYNPSEYSDELEVGSIGIEKVDGEDAVVLRF